MEMAGINIADWNHTMCFNIHVLKQKNAEIVFAPYLAHQADWCRMQIFEQVLADLKHKLAGAQATVLFWPLFWPQSYSDFADVKKNYVCEGCRMAVQPVSQKQESNRNTGGGPEQDTPDGNTARMGLDTPGIN